VIDFTDKRMRIACLLADGYEDAEFQQPYDAYRRVGTSSRRDWS
jgi:putative intracellular protease/amidase